MERTRRRRLRTVAIVALVAVGAGWLIATTPGVWPRYPEDHGVPALLEAHPGLDEMTVRCLAETLERGRGPVPESESGFVLSSEDGYFIRITGERAVAVIRFGEGSSYSYEARRYNTWSSHLLHCPTAGLVDQAELRRQREEAQAALPCETVVGVGVGFDAGGDLLLSYGPGGRPEMADRCDWSDHAKVGVGTEAEDGPLVPVQFTEQGTAHPPVIRLENRCDRFSVAVLIWRGNRYTEPLHGGTCEDPSEPVRLAAR